MIRGAGENGDVARTNAAFCFGLLVDHRLSGLQKPKDPGRQGSGTECSVLAYWTPDHNCGTFDRMRPLGLLGDLPCGDPVLRKGTGKHLIVELHDSGSGPPVRGKNLGGIGSFPLQGRIHRAIHEFGVSAAEAINGLIGIANHA
jgi:hypothetical protein